MRDYSCWIYKFPSIFSDLQFLYSRVLWERRRRVSLNLARKVNSARRVPKFRRGMFYLGVSPSLPRLTLDFTELHVN